MICPGHSIRHFLPDDDETVLNNRLALGLPTLLVTVLNERRSWMVGLDDGRISNPGLATVQRFESLQQWASQMCDHVRFKRTLSLIDGAILFLRSMRGWLEPQQLNDALFYVEGSEKGETTFETIATQVQRPLRHQ